jgi:hypothetical protein
MSLAKNISTGEQRVGSELASDSFTLTAGHYAESGLAAYARINLGVTGSSAAGSNLYGIAKLRFYGRGADNATADYRIFLAERSGTGLDLTYFGGGTVTLSTMLGTNSVAGPDTRMADTLTFTQGSSATTPTGPWNDAYAALVAAVATYSPANNTAAWLLIPELGSSCAMFIDVDLTGATSLGALATLID